MPKVLSLDKSLLVLEAIFQCRDGIGTRALASRLKFNVATIHNIARTFCLHGYLRQDPHTKVFYPGIRLPFLARHPSYLHTLSLPAMGLVDQLATRLNENVVLGLIDQGQVVSLHAVPGRQPLRVQESDEISRPLYCTALGKIVLHSLAETELETYLKEVCFEQFTPNTITDVTILKETLALIREHGFAQVRDESCEGVSALSVPIRDVWGNTVASLSVSVPTSRMDRLEYSQAILHALRQTAGAIEVQWRNPLREDNAKRSYRRSHCETSTISSMAGNETINA